MFALGKLVWYLPFAILAAVSLIWTVTELGYDRYIFANTHESYEEGASAILSTNTIAALREDARLHHALLGLAESIAWTLDQFGQDYGFESAKSFGESLTASTTELRKRYESKSRKRDVVGDLGQTMDNVLGGLGVNTTGGVSGIVGNLGSALVEGLATPALFLGIGVGVGASTGLNLTNMATAKAQASRVASTFNATATGVNLAAQNIGNGLAGQIAPSLGQSGMMNISIGPAAYALASGIGNATSRALKLTTQDFRPSNDSSIQAVAGNLGLGLSTPIVSNIDFQAVMKSVGGSGIGAMLAQQLPHIAAAAGNGLGEGARAGLGLVQTGKPANPFAKRQSSDPLQGLDVPGAVNQFTKGLSQSLLTGVDVANLTTSLNLTGSLGGMVDASMLPALAAGAGSGIGMGLAIGFTFKSANATPLIAQSANTSSNDLQTAMVAERFAQNLVSNFLLNSTVLQSVGTAIANSQPQILKNADVAKAAEGFARGTIEGVSTALSSIGGIQNLLSGNFSDDALMKVPVLDATRFNDSVNGSAVSFARGFMGEGVILIGDVLKKINQNANNTGPPPFRKRSIDTQVEDDTTIPRKALAVRQSQVNTTAVSPFPLAINEATIMGGGQLGINMLSCQGIGGVASVALGAMSASKNMPSMMSMMTGDVPLDPRAAQSLPQGPVEFTSEGNTFRIVLKDAEISINGLPLIPFGILTALHVLFIMLAFLLTLPLYLILGVVWRLSVLAGYPVNEAKNKKWRLGLLITFGISGPIGIVLGMVGMGNSRHFRDAHGIFGLIALILIFPTVGFTFVRLRSEALYPLPATFVGVKAPFALFKTNQKIYIISAVLVQIVFAIGQLTFINGFATLRSISLCIVDAVLTSNSVAGLMGLLLMVQITAAGMVGIRTWLEQHIAKREKAGIQRMTIVEAGVKTRKDSIATFGFGQTRSNAPPALDLDNARPPLMQRNTEELKGFEDDKISTPFNVRKEGADSTDFEIPRKLRRQPSAGLRENPFLSPAEQQERENRRTYDPKTAGYQYEYTSAIDDNTDYYNVPVGYQAQQPRSGRPSSDLIDPMNSPLPPGLRTGGDSERSYGSGGPKTQGVTMADLFPPPPPPPMDAQVQLTSRSASSSYSRPFNERGRPSSDAMRDFGSGPGGTVRARRYS